MIVKFVDKILSGCLSTKDFLAFKLIKARQIFYKCLVSK